MNGDNGRTSHDVIYFDSSSVEHIPKETKKCMCNKKIIANIYKIQAYDSIMRKYPCIVFIDFMLKGKIC